MTDSILSKANFIVIGAAKCGTSTLYHFLSQHEQICGSRRKEPAYFLPEGHKKNKVSSFKVYEALFDKAPDQLGFEATVDYTLYPELNDEIGERIQDYNPEMKLIYIVRDPIERIISEHRFMFKLGKIPKSERNINDHLRKSGHRVIISKYYSQILPFIKKFGKENILILTTDELKSDLLGTLNQILSFLSVSPFSSLPEGPTKINSRNRIVLTRKNNGLYRLKRIQKIIPDQLKPTVRNIFRPLFERNLSKSDSKISNPQVARLRRDLMPEIEGIEKLTSKDLSTWKKNLL